MTLNQDLTGQAPPRRPRRGPVVALLLAIAALIVVIGVAAGSGGGEFTPGTGVPAMDASTAPAAAPAPEEKAPTIGDLPLPDSLSEEDLYIKTLDMEGIYYSSEQAAIDAGYAVCDYLDAGASLLDAADIAMSDGGYSAYDAGYIVGAASTALCPGSGY